METNEILKERLEAAGLYTEEMIESIAEQGTLSKIPGIPDEVKKTFVCAHDVSPIWHVKMQAAFQHHTVNAVSKTVNFPHDATEEDVAEVYKLAFSLGCKGITIYRDGSRDEQVLTMGNGKENTPKETSDEKAGTSGEQGEEEVIIPRPRPNVTMGFTEKVKIGCGNLYITVNYDGKGICEVFTNTGRAGGCPSQSEATARLVSIALRSGLSSDVLVEQLRGIRCASTIRQKGLGVTSCPDAIAKTIEKVIKASKSGGNGIAMIESTAKKAAATVKEDKNVKYCPECGSVLEHEGGCVTCRECGYSKCG